MSKKLFKNLLTAVFCLIIITPLSYTYGAQLLSKTPITPITPPITPPTITPTATVTPSPAPKNYPPYFITKNIKTGKAPKWTKKGYVYYSYNDRIKAADFNLKDRLTMKIAAGKLPKGINHSCSINSLGKAECLLYGKIMDKAGNYFFYVTVKDNRGAQTGKWFNLKVTK